MRRSPHLILAAAAALVVVLAGCATPTTELATGATATTGERPAAGEPDQQPDEAPADVALVPVNPAELPPWFPADLPMPAGDYRWSAEYATGWQLDFQIADAGIAQALIADLAAAGYVETQFTEHPDGTGQTWFTEGPAFRANVVVRGIGSDKVLLTYNVEPK